jgi:hypothetical protein
MSDFQVEKLSRENYKQWCTRMKCVLILKKAWEAVNPGFGDNPTAAQTERNNVAIATILLAVDDQTLKDVEDQTTAREIWATLKTIHTSYDVWHGTLILFEFINLKMTADESVSSYLARRNELYDQVKDAGHTIQEKTRMCFVLKGLSKDYEPFARTLRDGDDEDPGDLTPKIKAKLLSEEKRLNSSKQDDEQLVTALRVKEMNIRKSQGRSQRQDHQPESRSQRQEYHSENASTTGTRVQTDRYTKCYNCRGIGHNAYQCPSESVEKPHTRAVLQDEGQERYQDPWSDDDDGYEEKIQKGEENTEDHETPHVNQTVALLTSVSFLSNSKRRWILDSAATKHMSPHKEGYISLEGAPPEKIHTAGTESLIARGTGTKQLMIKKNQEVTTTIRLDEVLWVPNLSSNLLSVPKLTEQGMSILMDRRNVTIKNKHGVIVAKGRKEGNFYILKDLSTRTGVRRRRG